MKLYSSLLSFLQLLLAITNTIALALLLELPWWQDRAQDIGTYGGDVAKVIEVRPYSDGSLEI